MLKKNKKLYVNKHNGLVETYIVQDSPTCRLVKKIYSRSLCNHSPIISPEPEFNYLTSGCFTDVTPVVPPATRPPDPICCSDLSKLILRLVLTPVDVVQDCLVQPLP